VHLARVRVSESAHFEVNDDQTAQTAMKENEVDAEPCIIQTQTPLTAKERKIIAQFQ